jgi:hypothetical protein
MCGSTRSGSPCKSTFRLCWPQWSGSFDSLKTRPDSGLRASFDSQSLEAREWFERFPKAAYMTEIESWRELAGDEIEFVMRRLPPTETTRDRSLAQASIAQAASAPL